MANENASGAGPKPLWWLIVGALVVLLVGATWIASNRSNKRAERLQAEGTNSGLAYDATTGRNVPAGALPGAEGTQAPPPSAERNNPNATANGEAGGTNAAAYRPNYQNGQLNTGQGGQFGPADNRAVPAPRR